MTSSLAPLLTTQGWELLQAWEARPERRHMDPLALGTALRAQGLEPEVASAVLAQLTLRDAAETKFGPIARHMVFTRDGLEQATRLHVAALHAKRFRDSGTTYLADLGCGIGTESLASATLGMRTLSVDIDEDAAAAAAVNLRDFPNSEVLRGDVLELDIPDLARRGVDAVFADPARRTGSKKGSARINDPEQWAPPLSTVLGWRAHIPAVGVKVAPGIAHDALPPDCHAQWTSVDGDLVEAALWTPPLAPEGPGRSAQVIRAGQAHVLRDEGAAAANAARTQAPDGPMGAFIAEADDAVMRSGALAQLAELLDMHLVDPRIAYLTGDTAPDSPFVTAFEVLEQTNLKPKAISAALKKLDIGRLEVKKRGADIDPAQLRRSVKLSGDRDGVVFATRVQGRHRAIVARRLG